MLLLSLLLLTSWYLEYLNSHRGKLFLPSYCPTAYVLGSSSRNSLKISDPETKTFQKEEWEVEQNTSWYIFLKGGGREFLLLTPSAFGEFEIYSTLKAPKSILYCKKLEMFGRTYLNLLPSPLSILKSLGQSWTRLCTPARRGGRL